jgi:hypothetical protein
VADKRDVSHVSPLLHGVPVRGICALPAEKTFRPSRFSL